MRERHPHDFLARGVWGEIMRCALSLVVVGVKCYFMLLCMYISWNTIVISKIQIPNSKLISLVNVALLFVRFF